MQQSRRVASHLWRMQRHLKLKYLLFTTGYTTNVLTQLLCANTKSSRTHKQQLRVRIRVHLHSLPIRCDSYAKLLPFVSIISLSSTQTLRISSSNNRIFYGTQVGPSIGLSTHLALRLLRTRCNSPVEEPHKLSGQTVYPSGAGTLYVVCQQYYRIGSIV